MIHAVLISAEKIWERHGWVKANPKCTQKVDTCTNGGPAAPLAPLQSSYKLITDVLFQAAPHAHIRVCPVDTNCKIPFYNRDGSSGDHAETSREIHSCHNEKNICIVDLRRSLTAKYFAVSLRAAHVSIMNVFCTSANNSHAGATSSTEMWMNSLLNMKCLNSVWWMGMVEWDEGKALRRILRSCSL